MNSPDLPWMTGLTRSPAPIDEELMELLGLDDEDEEPSPGILEENASLLEDEPDPGEPVEDPPYEDRPLEVLIDDLGSDDAEVRERAVDAIARRGSGAVAPLIEALSLADDRRRWCVAEALAALGDEAIPALIAALGMKRHRQGSCNARAYRRACRAAAHCGACRRRWRGAVRRPLCAPGDRRRGGSLPFRGA